MEIKRHLNENEMQEFLLNSTPVRDSHLEHCDICLNESTRLRDLLQELRTIGSEDEAFWTAQHTAIRNRIALQEKARSSKARSLAWGIATAMATISLASLLLLGNREHPTRTAPRTAVDPDHELLIEVERTLQTGGPEALEPAALLAREIGQHATGSGAAQHNKEFTHED